MIKTEALNRNTDSWLGNLKAGKMMDDDILEGGLSEMYFPFVAVISHPNTNETI